jgi:hypothetical protein
MPKPATSSPERAALAQAHTDLALRQEALAQAEADHQQARFQHNAAASDIDDIDDRIRALQGERCYGVPQLLAGVNDRLRSAYSARECAERDVHPLRVAEEHARARVADAERPIWRAHDDVNTAAIAVARAEAEPVARAALVRVLAAIEVILQHAPDLVAQEHRELLPSDLAQAVRTAAGGMLTKLRDWPPFEQKFHANPWRASVDLLKQDPTIPLPQAAP